MSDNDSDNEAKGQDWQEMINDDMNDWDDNGSDSDNEGDDAVNPNIQGPKHIEFLDAGQAEKAKKSHKEKSLAVPKELRMTTAYMTKGSF